MLAGVVAVTLGEAAVEMDVDMMDVPARGACLGGPLVVLGRVRVHPSREVKSARRGSHHCAMRSAAWISVQAPFSVPNAFREARCVIQWGFTCPDTCVS